MNFNTFPSTVILRLHEFLPQQRALVTYPHVRAGVVPMLQSNFAQSLERLAHLSILSEFMGLASRSRGPYET